MVFAQAEWKVLSCIFPLGSDRARKIQSRFYPHEVGGREGNRGSRLLGISAASPTGCRKNGIEHKVTTSADNLNRRRPKSAKQAFRLFAAVTHFCKSVLIAL